MKREREILRAVKRMARGKMDERELRLAYMEIFGAEFAGKVTLERACASIIEACKELLDRGAVSQPEGQEYVMEEILKQIVAEMEKSNEFLARIARAVEGKAPVAATTPEPGADDSKIKEYVKAHPEAKPADLIREFKISLNRAKGYLVDVTVAKTDAAPAQEKKQEITIEKLREMATKYTAAFGMDDLLDLNMKLGGEKKLSKLAPESYAVIYAEMEGRLSRENGKAATQMPAATAPVGALTLDAVKEKAKAFMDKNGAPAVTAILKVLGAEKLSTLAPEKYNAFVEAISNA